MEILKFKNIRYKQPSQSKHGTIKIDAYTYNFIRELVLETGLTTPKVMRKIIDYIEDKIEWVEDYESEE